jgi:hypothetical protein
MVKPWMLDELAHAGPEHLDPGFVAGFDRKQGYPDFADDPAVLAEGPRRTPGRTTLRSPDKRNSNVAIAWRMP